MTDPSLDLAASELAWVAPSAASLLRLARLPADTWSVVRTDPGAVLLLLRDDTTPSSLPFPASLLATPRPLERALRLLADPPGGRADWMMPTLAPLRHDGLTIAALAARIAERSGAVDPDRAWSAGLLAPLGWYALAAVAPERIATAAVDTTGIGRRLARAWRLPGWLAPVLGQVEFPARYAAPFGVDAPLLVTVRLAVHLARHRHGVARLTLQGDPLDDLGVIGLTMTDLDGLDAEVPVGVPWVDPFTQLLLPDVLALAIENRHVRDRAGVATLEREVDGLHAAFRDQLAGEETRVRREKLGALAEFAAGAGHEINNPLAVISGQAQYILGHEGDWFTGVDEGGCRKALQTIIGQTKRVHALLRDLMQFARPVASRPGWFDLPTLLGEVRAAQEEFAASRRIQTEVCARPERLAVYADREQVQITLTCLLRNAIEAAPADGFARLVLVDSGGEQITVAVEDSGPGPSAEQRPHLFDPFYSGRAAGRGRGLGLPVAWRLAQQQGGDVRLEATRAGEPTRFVVVLPRRDTPPRSEGCAA
ncbi:MAG: ATP-binding protein [Gemmataceae bacterium]